MTQRSQINLSTDELHNLSFDAFDEAINHRSKWHDFDAIVEDAISRRGFLGGVIAMGSVAGLSAATTVLTPVSAHAATSRFGFEAVSVSTKDTVVVPKGYNWHVETLGGILCFQIFQNLTMQPAAPRPAKPVRLAITMMGWRFSPIKMGIKY